MFRLLRQPYPYEEKNLRTHFIAAFVAGILVAAVLLILRPFSIPQHISWIQFLFLAGFGLVTTVVYLFFSVLIPALLPKIFREKSWTVGRQILWSAIGLLSITTGNLGYNWAISHDDFSWQNFQSFLGYTVAIGIVPTMGITLLNYIIKLRQYERGAQVANTAIHQPHAPQKQLAEQWIFTGENANEKLELDPEALLFIESADNYAAFYFVKEGKTMKILLRGSLTRFEEMIRDERLFRCHRAYLVNLPRIENVTGNSQGYKLHFSATEIQVPVSRGLTKKFQEKIGGKF